MKKILSVFLLALSCSLFAESPAAAPAPVWSNPPPTFTASGAAQFFQDYQGTNFKQPQTPMFEKQVQILIWVMNSPAYAKMLKDPTIGNGKLTAVDIQKTAQDTWTARFDFVDVQGNMNIPGGPNVELGFSAFATMKGNPQTKLLGAPVFAPIAKPMQSPANPSPKP